MDSYPSSPSSRYKVSKLSTSIDSWGSDGSVPKLKIRNRMENIVIPSVKQDYSPRSNPSQSHSANHSANNTARDLKSSGKLSSTNKTSLHNSFKSQVRILGGKDMSIDLHPSAVNTPTGLTKLKVLENYLPRELRSSFKSHAMQQHQHIKSKLKSKLSRSLTSGLHADNLRLLESYVPRHNSSGAMSVSNLLDNDTETTDEYGEPYTEESSAEVDELQDKLGRNGNITSRGERRQAKGILWGTDPTETVLAREERERQQRAEVLSAKLEEDHKRYLSEEEKRREEEKAQILKLKVMNTLFNKNITYENGMAPIVNARWPSHANFVLHANSPTEKELKERNKRIDYNLLATGNVELVDSVPLFKTAGGQKSSMKTTYQAAVSAVSDTRNENDEESSANCQISTAEEYEAQLEGADFEDPNDPMKIKVRSKVREKLNELSRYVNTHSQRKIINAWNSIEGRFKSSPLTKTVMVQGAKGLSYPSKQNALYASTVASVLCSTRVKVGWRELQYVFGQIGITSEETFLARRVAAINLMLSLNRSTSSPIALMMKAELQELQQKSEKLITLEELTEVVFPKDPEERAMEFEIVKSRKQEEVRAMLDEKKRKDELKDVTEARRKRLMLDLESSLKEIQLPRNNINEIKFQAMRSLIEFCQETNAAFLEDQDTNITPEVMGFLGKEAFPKIIVEKVFEKFEKRRKGAINKSRSISITAIDNFSATMMLDGEVEKVKLSGPPNVVALLRETVSYGKGLNGMLFKDVVAMLQCIASTELQTMFRCYSRRYRYTEARRRWKLKESNIKASHFQAWGYLVHHIVSTRDYCWRKVKAWRFFTRRVRERRETFRVCFWPMFTWRKMINASAVAKEKARFLANRIVPTLLTMKTFRGWKKYVQENCALAMIARSFYKKMLQKALLCSLNWLHDWARKRRKIRRAWIREGLVKLRAVQFKRKQTPFMIWRSYTKYRTLVRSRIKSESSPFRHALIGNRSVLKRRSLAEKRLAAGKAYRKEQEENKKRKRDGKKRPPSSAKKRPDSREPSRKGSRSKGSRGRSISDASESSDNDDASAKSASTTNNVHMVFLWLKDVTRNYDMDSDGEDKEDIPNRIATTYSASVSALTEAIRPFPKPFSYLSFLEEYIQEQSHKIYLGYHHTDKWNIFESACRFHRFGWLVFRNLQIYALIKKKVRKFVAKRQRVIKEIVFQALLDLVKTGTRRGALYNLTEAERLNNLVRGHQVNQLVFRRKTSQELKKVIGKTSPSAEEQKRLLAKAKRPFSPSNAVQSKLNERQKHLVGQDGQLYSPPNLLQKDREARVVEERLAKEMLAFSRTIKGQLEAATSEADVGSSEISSTNKKKATAVDEILSMESSITAAAIAKQEEYVSQFKVHAAEILLNVLAKVYVEVQISLVKEETKIYFRALRFPMVLKRSISMYNRKRMINWIRICRRLNSLNAQAPFYRSRRLLWIRFNRWLKFVAKEKLNATPGIIPVIQRRCFLHPDFSRALMKKGFQKIVYHNSKRLGQSTSDYHSLFMRWKSYTQERLLFAMLKAKAKKLFQLRLVQKCLWALKTGLSVGENMHLIANEPKKFPILRVEADLDQLTKRFISQRRAGVAHVITKYNRKFSEKMKNAGRKALSFKLFLTQFEEETTARINNEQRILSESFEQRGQQEFIDVYAPDKDDPIMPEIMARMEGKIIADPHQEATDGRDIVLPGGFRVLKMKFVLQDNTTIVGWQIVWGADGCKDIESPRRGTWNSASITIHELVVPKDDFIIGLEYLYDGAAMLGVRLKLFLNGFTRWIGKKNSMSTLSVYLSAEMAPTEDFEKDRETFGNDEKKHPALPYNFVVGLTGKLVNGKTTCLSLIVRKIISQNVFSYFWVKDVLDSMAADQSAAADAANKSVGLHVDSLPSQVIYRERIAAEGRVVEESLTMTDALNQRKNVLDASKSDTIGAYSGMNNDGRENKIDEPAEINSSDGKTEEDGDDDRSASNDEKSIGSQSIDSADAISLYSAKTLTSLEQRKRDKKLQIRKKQFEERLKVPLNMLITESERQFFDVMRMRMTELTCAVQRAYDFARKLWTKKDFRTDPQLSKLTGIRIVSRLCMWYFNSISRRLMRLCPSEKKGMQLLRSGKRMLQNADTIRKRAIAAKLSCIIAENSVHSWTGKALLAPSERAEKRELQLRMSKLREQAQKDEKDSKEITLKGKELLRAGKLLLPRIELSQSIYTNYRLKVLASRHKQSLLERMDMETIKNGLFGIDQRESTLSRLHMESIHSSLKERKTLLNMQKKEDPHSLDRFIETVIEEEAELEIVEERQRRATAMTNATLSEWQKSTVKRDSIGPSYMANTIRRSQSIRQPIKRHSTAAEVDRKPTKF